MFGANVLPIFSVAAKQTSKCSDPEVVVRVLNEPRDKTGTIPVQAWEICKLAIAQPGHVAGIVANPEIA